MALRLVFFLSLSLALAVAAAEEYEVSADSMRMVDGRFTFIGDVQVTGESLTLDADRIVVVDGDYQVEGSPAKMVHREGGIETDLAGKSIFYSEKDSNVEMRDGGRIVRGDMTVRAGKMSFDLAGGLLRTSGGVNFDDGQMTASGNAASSSGARDAILLRLEGDPAVIDIPGEEEGVRLQASASRIEYDESRGLIRLVGDVVANLGKEKLTGDAIDYNIKQGSFSAESSDGEGRVRATIQTQ